MDNLKPEELEDLKALYEALRLFKTKEDEERFRKDMEEMRKRWKEKETN